MIPRLLIRPEARAEIVEAVNRLNLSASPRGEAFLHALDDRLNYIAGFPFASPISFDFVRRCNIPKFPYALLYFSRERDNERLITVIALIHERSDPQSWRTRSVE